MRANRRAAIKYMNGLLPVRLGELVIRRYRNAAGALRGRSGTQVVLAPSDAEHAFQGDAIRRAALLDGLNDIGLTLQHVQAIGL